MNRHNDRELVTTLPGAGLIALTSHWRSNRF
ncbi:hypothetical protein V12B01_13575 [Vibrio splendidus 12B01]|nr:hypothetical protein V12B01_13575 [Vibrio splendidus 12B01]